MKKIQISAFFIFLFGCTSDKGVIVPPNTAEVVNPHYECSNGGTIHYTSKGEKTCLSREQSTLLQCLTTQPSIETIYKNNKKDIDSSLGVDVDPKKGADVTVGAKNKLEIYNFIYKKGIEGNTELSKIICSHMEGCHNKKLSCSSDGVKESAKGPYQLLNESKVAVSACLNNGKAALAGFDKKKPENYLKKSNKINIDKADKSCKYALTKTESFCSKSKDFNDHQYLNRAKTCKNFVPRLSSLSEQFILIKKVCEEYVNASGHHRLDRKGSCADVQYQAFSLMKASHAFSNWSYLKSTWTPRSKNKN